MTAGLSRRALLASSVAVSALAACGARDAGWAGDWVGESHERGHRLRDRAALPLSALQRRADLIIVGGGIAGLAAARAARRAGIANLVLFELHDAPGGNSRSHPLSAAPCPLGAHYLPLPGPHAHEVAEWLHEIGVARHEAGRTVYDEQHLCHSPQERLFFDGAWHEGLLPPADAGSPTLAQYRRFAQQVAQVQREAAFALPTRRTAWSPELAALDGQTFAHWLGTRGLDDAQLRWYLDYCCRDDYGAGSEVVSAWAGLHYFASRHGFQAPGVEADERDAVLTWPEGNAWLVQRLAAPLRDRLQTACVVQRVAVERHAVTVELWNDAAQRSERWTAPQVVVATPLFVAARIVRPLPAALGQAAAALRYAPWLVANLELRTALLDRIGVGLAWDNVSYGSQSLGYVNALHQSLSPATPGGRLTAYRALPVSDRATLWAGSWQHWAAQVIGDLALTHPDLPAQLARIDLTRHGHAMSIPTPGVRGHSALKALHEGGTPRLHWAHSDLAGYSVFEEAFTAGDAAGRAAARALRGR
jgi:monoamine oxidase